MIRLSENQMEYESLRIKGYALQVVYNSVTSQQVEINSPPNIKSAIFSLELGVSEQYLSIGTKYI